jgi:uncharacterized protein DUF6894
VICKRSHSYRKVGAVDASSKTGAAMPEYFFAIRCSDGEHKKERDATLEDGAAALQYACGMAQELSVSGEHDDPGLMVTVRDEMRQIVLSIPLRPACA